VLDDQQRRAIFDSREKRAVAKTEGTEAGMTDRAVFGCGLLRHGSISVG
jgi:hypothetical protein